MRCQYLIVCACACIFHAVHSPKKGSHSLRPVHTRGFCCPVLILSLISITQIKISIQGIEQGGWRLPITRQVEIKPVMIIRFSLVDPPSCPVLVIFILVDICELIVIYLMQIVVSLQTNIASIAAAAVIECW